MNPWTALLESLHSSLVDELTELHPEPKPILGMPVRQPYFAPPPSATDLLVCEVQFEKSRGFALLAFESAFMKALKLAPADLWKAILKRAGSEFMRRNIRPIIGVPVEFKPKESLPAGFSQPSRVIWIPFEIPKGSCYLGLGV